MSEIRFTAGLEADTKGVEVSEADQKIGTDEGTQVAQNVAREVRLRSCHHRAHRHYYRREAYYLYRKRDQAYVERYRHRLYVQFPGGELSAGY